MSHSMEFWGEEVQAGKPVKVNPEAGILIHLSQAALGESNKKAESVFLYANVRGQKVCLGTLSNVKFSQLSFDLVFESEFELSHTWKHGSVFFSGYKAHLPEDGEEFSSDISSSDESDEEEIPSAVAAKDKSKPDTEKAKTNAETAEPSDYSSDDVDDSSDDKTSSEEDSDDSDESSEEEDTPVKADVSKKDAGKKRQSESATKTPQSKKAKSATPEKTDGKKGVHTATPHPAKGKSAALTPKSSAQVQCNTCSKTFNNDKALQSHSKSKHGGK